MDYLKKSRIEEVLIAILGKGTVTSQLISRIEKILDAIRVNGSYDGIAMSEVEEILVCILLGKRFEKPTHSRIAAMLKVKANGGEYTELRKSRVEELIFEWINAVESATYIGTLPATLQTVKGYLESYKIYGNAVQDGTPTPENPIMPSGCGVRMVNLFDKNATLDGYWLSSATGVAVPQSGYSVSDYIRTNEGESYTNVEAGKTFCWYDENKSFIRTTTQATTASAPTGAAYFRVNLYTRNKGIAMVVAGSTAPTEYIPYGYKLPLTANGVEYPIYLGEVETTRKIKKLVLTGGGGLDEDSKH